MASIKMFVIFIVAILIAKVVLNSCWFALLHNWLNIAGNEVSSFQTINTKYVSRVRGQVMEQTGDNKETQFLIQKIAIDVQRGNAASVMATIPSSQEWAEFISLPLV